MDSRELAALLCRAVNHYAGWADDDELSCTVDDYQQMRDALLAIMKKVVHDSEVYTLAVEALPPARPRSPRTDEAKCSECGKVLTVPLEDRPFVCGDCFRAPRSANAISRLPERMHGRLERMAADLRYQVQMSIAAGDEDRAAEINLEASLVERCANELAAILREEQGSERASAHSHETCEGGHVEGVPCDWCLATGSRIATSTIVGWLRDQGQRFQGEGPLAQGARLLWLDTAVRIECGEHVATGEKRPATPAAHSQEAKAWPCAQCKTLQGLGDGWLCTRCAWNPRSDKAEPDYSWIKVRRYVDDPTKTWEERYRTLERHHEAETKFLISEMEKRRSTQLTSDVWTKLEQLGRDVLALGERVKATQPTPFDFRAKAQELAAIFLALVHAHAHATDLAHAQRSETTIFSREGPTRQSSGVDVDEVCAWLEGLERIRVQVERTTSDPEERSVMGARAGIDEGVAADIRNRWGARVEETSTSSARTRRERIKTRIRGWSFPSSVMAVVSLFAAEPHGASDARAAILELKEEGFLYQTDEGILELKEKGFLYQTDEGTLFRNGRTT